MTVTFVVQLCTLLLLGGFRGKSFKHFFVYDFDLTKFKVLKPLTCQASI